MLDVAFQEHEPGERPQLGDQRFRRASGPSTALVDNQGGHMLCGHLRHVQAIGSIAAGQEQPGRSLIAGEGLDRQAALVQQVAAILLDHSSTGVRASVATDGATARAGKKPSKVSTQLSVGLSP